MNARQAIAERWQFELPPDYLLALELGLLADGVPGALNHSVLWWQSPEDIAGYDWPEHKIKTFVPFAREPSSATLCWSTEHGPGWVFYSPNDSDQAEGFAPSFAGATFRAFIEDLRGTCVARNMDWSVEQLRASLRQCLSTCERLWRPEWHEVATRLAERRPVVGKSDLVEFAPWDEIQSEISRLLTFSMLNAEVLQCCEGL